MLTKVSGENLAQTTDVLENLNEKILKYGTNLKHLHELTGYKNDNNPRHPTFGTTNLLYKILKSVTIFTLQEHVKTIH